MYVSRGTRAHTCTDRASSRKSFPRKLRWFLRREVWDYIFFFFIFFLTLNHSGKGKSEAKEGKGRARERVNVARDAQSHNSHFYFFLSSSRKLYNLRYVTSPSKIHFTIHTNIYNRYINNMAITARQRQTSHVEWRNFWFNRFDICEW